MNVTSQREPASVLKSEQHFVSLITGNLEKSCGAYDRHSMSARSHSLT